MGDSWKEARHTLWQFETLVAIVGAIVLALSLRSVFGGSASLKVRRFAFWVGLAFLARAVETFCAERRSFLLPIEEVTLSYYVWGVVGRSLEAITIWVVIYVLVKVNGSAKGVKSE